LAGQQEEARKILADLELQLESGAVSPFHVAIVHLGLGEYDSAMDLLEQAFQARTGYMMYINRGPRFDPLRGDDRFDALVKKMGW
jgi:serine/threonine-protein kinase